MRHTAAKAMRKNHFPTSKEGNHYHTTTTKAKDLNVTALKAKAWGEELHHNAMERNGKQIEVEMSMWEWKIESQSEKSVRQSQKICFLFILQNFCCNTLPSTIPPLPSLHHHLESLKIRGLHPRRGM